MIGLALWAIGWGVDGGTQAQRQPVELKPLATLDPRAITDLIHNGRADSAVAVLSAPVYAGSSDPMVYLLRARAMRDQMSDEDDNKSLIQRDGALVLAQIDSALALCDAAIERGASDPVFHYYRGRGYLAKAQIQTLTHSYWSAGRSAANAKRDLEKYLERAPDDPDAQGDLGAFLYFADTLPGVLKFFSKFFGIPGGDRERGLEMLRYAATHDGVFSVDYQIALAAIDLLFEGQLERGIAAMRALIDEHPQYTRLVEPFGVLIPLDPLRVRDHQRLEDRVLAERFAMVDAKMDTSLVKRIQLHRALADIYFRAPSAAMADLTALIEDPVTRPDWFLPLAIVNRGQLYAKSGRTDEALQAFETIAGNEEMNHFHSLAYGLIGSLKEPWKVVELEHLDFVGVIYDGRLDEAQAGLREYGRLYGRDVVFYFYLGEIETFRQNLAAAQRAYEATLKIEVEGGDENYQLLASLRLAELAGLDGKYDKAKKYVEDATKFTHAGYLFDFMIHSRKRFFEALSEGKTTTAPTLLLKQSAADSASPQAVHQ
jgi:tetratricopeptide (TPR) repeat protein